MSVHESVCAPDVEAALKSRESAGLPRPAHEVYLNSLLHRRARIELTDGRIFEGSLNCFDSHGNIILIDAIQIKSDDKFVRIGQILAGGKHIKQLLIQKEKESEKLVEKEFQSLKMSE